jgi:hypothetical protein
VRAPRPETAVEVEAERRLVRDRHPALI